MSAVRGLHGCSRRSSDLKPLVQASQRDRRLGLSAFRSNMKLISPSVKLGRTAVPSELPSPANSSVTISPPDHVVDNSWHCGLQQAMSPTLRVMDREGSSTRQAESTRTNLKGLSEATLYHEHEHSSLPLSSLIVFSRHCLQPCPPSIQCSWSS